MRTGCERSFSSLETCADGKRCEVPGRNQFSGHGWTRFNLYTVGQRFKMCGLCAPSSSRYLLNTEGLFSPPVSPPSLHLLFRVCVCVCVCVCTSNLQSLAPFPASLFCTHLVAGTGKRWSVAQFPCGYGRWPPWGASPDALMFQTAAAGAAGTVAVMVPNGTNAFDRRRLQARGQGRRARQRQRQRGLVRMVRGAVEQRRVLTEKATADSAMTSSGAAEAGQRRAASAAAATAAATATPWAVAWPRGREGGRCRWQTLLECLPRGTASGCAAEEEALASALAFAAAVGRPLPVTSLRGSRRGRVAVRRAP